jgi:serine/threonine protein phosphatase 1
MPAGHRAFFARLRVIYRAGDYAFVHAGVRPDVALDAQDELDLIWIREQFLNSDADFGACVVHGHTIAPEPVRKHNRIGLDTGAYGTGRLSCAVLEDDRVRILQT